MTHNCAEFTGMQAVILFIYPCGHRWKQAAISHRPRCKLERITISFCTPKLPLRTYKRIQSESSLTLWCSQDLSAHNTWSRFCCFPSFVNWIGMKENEAKSKAVETMPTFKSCSLFLYPSMWFLTFCCTFPNKWSLSCSFSNTKNILETSHVLIPYHRDRSRSHSSC